MSRNRWAFEVFDCLYMQIELNVLHKPNITFFHMQDVRSVLRGPPAGPADDQNKVAERILGLSQLNFLHAPAMLPQSNLL